ncbi:MAG TPA: hypothetical protein VF049_22325 [Nocardioidaceae bacterium]
MPERNRATNPPTSHLTQENEALRQARLDTDTRTALRYIADRLDHIQPHRLMTEANRIGIALTAAHHTRDQQPPTAIDELENHLLRRMPYATSRAITRAEYAAQLRLIAQGVRL